LKEISQLFEGNFGQNKEKKRIFWFFKVEALVEWLMLSSFNMAALIAGYMAAD
jgi:hypothetical protein